MNVTAAAQSSGTGPDLLDSSNHKSASYRSSVRHGEDTDAPHAADDAPTTPVVYLVMWTSVSLGVLRGYITSDLVAARQTPSYTRTFNSDAQFHRASMDPFCATGVDGLPGISWYEFLIEVLPSLVPLLGAGFLMKRGRKAGIVLGCCLAIVGQILLASAVKLVLLYLGSAVAQSAADILFL
eukprot:gene14714-14882_t